MTLKRSQFLIHSCTPGKYLLNLQENGLQGSGVKCEPSSVDSDGRDGACPGQSAQPWGGQEEGKVTALFWVYLKRCQPL